MLCRTFFPYEPSACELIWSDHDFRLISEFEPHKIASRFSRQIKHFRAPCARIWLVWGHGSSQVLYWHHGRVWSSSSTMQATRWWWQKGPMFWFLIKYSQIKFLSSFLFGIPSPKSLLTCRLWLDRLLASCMTPTPSTSSTLNSRIICATSPFTQN